MRNPVLLSRRQFALSAASLAAAGLAGCAGNNAGTGTPLSEAPVVPAGPPQSGTEIGGGQYKVALILPLSAGGNAGMAAQSMKNAAEMALAEFSNPDIQLLVKDDAGNPQMARMVAGQAMDEGAQIILGPLFAQSVQAAGAAARPRNVPVIGFSTDASVAARGVSASAARRNAGGLLASFQLRPRSVERKTVGPRWPVFAAIRSTFGSRGS